MLSIQKSSSDKTRLRYVTSFSTYDTSTSASHEVIFVPPNNNTKLGNNDSKMELGSEVKNNKEKSILGVPLKTVKKEGK